VEKGDERQLPAPSGQGLGVRNYQETLGIASVSALLTMPKTGGSWGAGTHGGSQQHTRHERQVSC
jgi:hypothetical protein